jgi:hypothetical protein
MSSQIVYEKRKGSAELQKDGQNGLSFSMSVTFLVVTDDKETSREEVLLNTPGLPIVGLVYGPLGATCKSKKGERNEDNPLYWDVTCDFETGTESQKQNPANPSPDPTTWIPIFRVDSFMTKERVLTIDKTPASAGSINFGVPGPYPITNSARQPFDDPLTETRQLCQFSFVQFEDPSQDLDDIMDRNDSVNETTFAGRAARTLLLNVTGAELGSFGGYGAWRVTYQCTYDPETHDVKLMDVGTCYLDSGTQKPYLEGTNNVAIIGNLNGSGAKATNAATLTFRVKDEIDFADFIRTA